MLKAGILTKYNLPKFGNSDEECEDAFSYKSTKGFLKIALADGATESSFAREWARLLVEDLVNSRHLSLKQILGRLNSLKRQWITEVTKNPLPWYAEAKLEKGAFSTLLGLSINLKKQTYYCIAIGDCCLFHIRKGDMILSFPVLHSSEFSNNPFLLSTKNGEEKELLSFMKQKKDCSIEKGDYILLMSDALAHWFTIENEKNEKPWEILIGFSEDLPNAFESWLNDKRKEKMIKNDDTTLITINAT